MNFERGTISSSPYVGIFSSVTEEVALLPYSALSKEVKVIKKKLEVKTIQTSLAGTSLLGLLCVGLGNKFVVSEITKKEEIKTLEKEGLEIMQIEDYTSTGNLIALNKNAGVASPLLKEETIKKLNSFFGIKFKKLRVAQTDLAGACLTVTNKGFIAHPNITEKDFLELEKNFKVNGKATTANYGDLFMGNDVIANTKGVIAGALTSGIELSKIDEGLRGE